MTSRAGPSAPALVLLAAGHATRFGGPKALEPLGPGGETLIDYALFDGLRAGCRRVVVVVGDATAEDVRSHVRTRLGESALPVHFPTQRLDDLPDGRTPPPGRIRPWGTGHAVLAARSRLPGDFVVANTDDFYWPGAYRDVVAHLAGGEAAPGRGGDAGGGGAVAAYRLLDTLTGPGGVSRALLEVDGAGFVTAVVEGKELRREGAGVAGRTVDGGPLSLSGEELVSMNLWGLPARTLPLLASVFVSFLDRHGEDATREFLLSEALDEQARQGFLRVKGLPQPRAGFGITFPEDVAVARRKLAEVVASEGYPAPLGPALQELAARVAAGPGAAR